MDNQIGKQDLEIDIKQLAMELMNKIWVILLVAAIAAVAAFMITSFLLKPIYTSSTKVFILNKQTESMVTANDLQLSTQLAGDYEQLIKSRYVLETTIADLGLEVEASELSKAIAVSATTGTRIIAIAVKDGDPYMAQKIANKIREVARTQIVSIMNVDAVNIVDEANLPRSPSSSNAKTNALIGALLGFVLACGVIILMYVLNDTIRTTEDVERYLGLSILGVIPINDEKRRKDKNNTAYGKNKILDADKAKRIKNG